MIAIKENELKQILTDIKDFVIVTGSYAEGTQTLNSDIDFYIKFKPEDEVNLEADYVEDTYCMPLIRYFEKKEYHIDSVYVDSFHIDDTIIPLEFSSSYIVDENNVFEIDVLGVKMKASLSLFKRLRLNSKPFFIF